MRLPQTRLQEIKRWIHLAQALLLFFAWALTIGVFTTKGSTDGRTGWFFGLCWLTIPILIYLAMVPAWSRARRLSNVYAFAALDSISVVLWLSGWAAVTSYVVSGKGGGTATDGAAGCDNFKYGSATKCKLSEATIFFGVLIMLLFIPTAFVSFKAVMEYQRTGILPNQTGTAGAGPLGGAKPITSIEDEAFDSNMNARNDWEVDEYDHDQFHQDARQGGGQYSYQRAEMHDDDEYTSAIGAHSRNQSEVVPGASYNHHLPPELSAASNASYDDLSQVRPTVPGGPLGHEDTSYVSPGGYGGPPAYERGRV